MHKYFYILIITAFCRKYQDSPTNQHQEKKKAVVESAVFLRDRFPGLATSPEVKKIAKRKAAQSGEPIARDPQERIGSYLFYLKELVSRPDGQGIAELKEKLCERYVVRVEDIPDSYWQAQLRVVRNRGESGDWQDLPKEEVLKRKQEHLAQTKEDQQGSIKEWIDYLTSDKSAYLPDHLK